MARKLFLYGVMFALTGLTILAGIELILPHFERDQRLTHHRWGNRPHTLLPGVWHRSAKSYYDVMLHANRLGFNDVDHELPKPPGRLRMLLLGDSFVEGVQVAPELHMARLLEAKAAGEGRALEVIVMGTSGWGQSHELATYESVGRAFDPDLVVAFFCPNDLWNNLVGVEGKEGPPVYSLDSAGNLVANLEAVPETPPTPAQYEKHLREPRFPGLRVARRLVRESYRLLRGEDEGAAKAAALGELPEAVRGEPRRGPRGIPADKQAMFERLVREMKQRIVDRDGRRMWVVLVNGDARHEPKRPYRRMMSWVADTYIREGLEVIDLDPLFRERARREQRYPAWEHDLHWNETGHAWVAETLYARSAPLLAAATSATAADSHALAR